jgi:peptidoglycan biosynthesis protein MviN/MurJ (putative lipid II flippase)
MTSSASRKEIADRVRVPVWYMAVSAVALIALFAAPALTKHGHRDVAVWAITIPCVAIIGLVGFVIRRNSGLNLSRDSRALPSTRPVTYATLIAVAVGTTITWLVADWGTAGATLAAGAICAVVVLVVEQQALAAVRREIRHGS